MEEFLVNALVLGATGQLGANLTRALLARGHHVRAFIRPASPMHTLAGLDIERVYGDLRDYETVARACRGVQVVYQAASYYPHATIPVDEAKAQALAETNNLLEAVRHNGVDRLVFTSTLTTIGPPRQAGQLADETCPFTTSFPNNPYLVAKAAMEARVLEAAQQGIPAVVVNPTVFLGPYDRKPTSGTQIVLIAKRLMPGYIQGPVNVIDVRDVAEAMINAADRGRIGERYIIGNWNTTQKDLNALIAKVAGVPAPFLPVPFSLARAGAKVGEWTFRMILRRPPLVPAFFVEMFPHMQQYNCTKAINELAYPRHPVEQAIRDALEWFKQNGYV
ncbi:MAG: NAD-dependent epimerase/dehydratase family protein [Nitrospirae bacterium]|nr:MAG: NAD-dependent epimerase/dehydratase family protein [Nitrospirota bacterium]